MGPPPRPPMPGPMSGSPRAQWFDRCISPASRPNVPSIVYPQKTAMTRWISTLALFLLLTSILAYPQGTKVMTNSSNGEGIYKELLETSLKNAYTPIEWEGFTPYNTHK